MSRLKKILIVICVMILSLASVVGCKPKPTGTVDESSQITSSAQGQSEENSDETSDEISEEPSDDMSDDLSDDISDETSSEPGSSTDEASEQPASSGGTSTSPSQSSSSSISHVLPLPTNSTAGIVKDMKGRTVIITYPLQTNEMPTDKREERFAERIAEIEEEYNCKIVVSPLTAESADGGGEKIKLSVLAGAPIVDVWYIKSLHFYFRPYYVAGLIQPLETFKCFDFSLPKFQDEESKFYTINNLHYGIGRSDTTAWETDYVMFYRKDILEAAGVAPSMMPDVLMKNGNWTWANFETIAKKVKTAGYRPIYNRSWEINVGDFYSLMMYTYGASSISMDSNTQKATFTADSSKGLQALAHYTRLATEGTIDPKHYFQTGFRAANDTVAFETGYAYWARWLYPYSASPSAKDNWAMVLPPKVNASDPYTIIADPGLGCFSIPYGVKRPFDAATVLQALHPLCDTPARAAAQKAEAIDRYAPYLSVNGADESLDVLQILIDRSYTSQQKYSYDQMGGGPGVYQDWAKHVLKIAQGEENANSVIAANKSRYNELLKDLWVIR